MKEDLKIFLKISRKIKNDLQIFSKYEEKTEYKDYYTIVIEKLREIEKLVKLAYNINQF